VISKATRETLPLPIQKCKYGPPRGGPTYIPDQAHRNRYAQYETRWSDAPESEEEWLQRAQDVADVLALDAGTRDRANKSPRAEIALLKHAGLLKLLGPRQYGGGDQSWSVGYTVIRKVAEADG
jgi:alkylation response protein AidB-like acyl-CoA dehydrogenase